MEEIALHPELDVLRLALLRPGPLVRADAIAGGLFVLVAADPVPERVES